VSGLVLLTCSGWALAAVLVLRSRRRLALVADAEHELRGAAAAIGLAAERMAREGATAPFTWLVRLQLDRMGGALADLAAAAGAGRGRIVRAPPPDDPRLEAGRLAQVLGNLIANATEHGVGPVDVRTSRRGGRIRIEIGNQEQPHRLAEPALPRPTGRGRGLAIAERAARELGGRLTVESRNGETRASLELPADRAA
jgi:C4-dicarboxylate-specific signal transduction histidine kinase